MLQLYEEETYLKLDVFEVLFKIYYIISKEE